MLIGQVVGWSERCGLGWIGTEWCIMYKVHV